jgi:hypothetical protein
VLRDSGNLSAAPWTLAGMESAGVRHNGHRTHDAAGVTEMTSSVDWRLSGELSAAAGKVASLLEAAAPLELRTTSRPSSAKPALTITATLPSGRSTVFATAMAPPGLAER